MTSEATNHQLAAALRQVTSEMRERRQMKAAALCAAAGSRDRVCAAPSGHEGNHSFVLRTVREE